MFSKAEYRSAMIKRQLNDTNVANILDITRQALSYKINGQSKWSLEDVYILKSNINLSDKEIMSIFFARELNNKGK